LGDKLYSLNEKELNIILKSFNALESGQNLGVLLNGLKGTGKSVMAKMICNDLVKKGYPVFLIDKAGFESYINDDVKQDCVFFVDEFEKLYKSVGEDSPQTKLLSIMDGSKSSNHRRLFLLTTNEEKIDENLVNRPSRIRYKIPFGSLNKDQVEEIVDDILINKEFRYDIISNILLMPIITIDLVKSIVKECNLLNQPYSEFAYIFNAEREVLYQQIHLLYTLDGIEEEYAIQIDKAESNNYAKANKSMDNNEYTIFMTTKQLIRVTSREFVNSYLEDLSRDKVVSNTGIGFGKAGQDVVDTCDMNQNHRVTLKKMQNLPDNRASYLLCVPNAKVQLVDYGKPIIGYITPVYKNSKYLNMLK
jgi:SpoVK/Ycf46/Vps4 family AAA+-type ATPase